MTLYSVIGLFERISALAKGSEAIAHVEQKHEVLEEVD
jgi:hypothetical protein